MGGGGKEDVANIHRASEFYVMKCLTEAVGLSVLPQMSPLYSEVLDRLDRAKKNLIMEE